MKQEKSVFDPEREEVRRRRRNCRRPMQTTSRVALCWSFQRKQASGTFAVASLFRMRRSHMEEFTSVLGPFMNVQTRGK
ncbi:Hypothetical protein SMAX5B_007088 [Scophthalmus maximus]|uniref:Uncharacterized protein n=1 Tax=Scophthalmus maximus TaxID=52904 RepID=A0A2U9B0H0_SCOMX|nr:Hypothetical protein SMAX5B_007088 [Scophthalmus maximus]